MSRLWSRKRTERNERSERPEPKPAASDPADDARLDDDSHAWWAKADVEDVWKPRQPRNTDDVGKRDILAEHFGDDWRTNFLHQPPSEEELEEERRREQQAVDDQDPYKVLQIDETATWDEIVAAHRRLARVHHPDRLFGQSELEKAQGEDRIRVINQAYQELRVRRGR